VKQRNAIAVLAIASVALATLAAAQNPPSRQDLARLRARDRVPEEPWQIAGEARAEPEVLPEWHDPSR
jgi:hypothetical protein